MDGNVKLWDPFRSKECVRELTSHTGGVKEVRWAPNGTQLLSCSYDKTVKLTDVETGQCVQTFPHDEYITSIAIHPGKHSVIMSGGYRQGVTCWDMNSNSVIQRYSGLYGQVQSIEFVHGGKHFLTCSDVTKKNSLDRAILVWDFESSVILSNQVYAEAFTCTSLAVHPGDKHFIANTQGDYIAIFSSNPPYKMDRHKRFEGHHVHGHPIRCEIRPDGDIVSTGSDDGSVLLFNWTSTHLVKKWRAHAKACVDAVFHPLLPSVMATCDWDGNLSVWE